MHLLEVSCSVQRQYTMACRITSEPCVLMSPVAVVRKRYVFMRRVTVVPKDRRTSRFLPSWGSSYA